MTRIIDIDAIFKADLEDWMAQNHEEGMSPDRMERLVPDFYQVWQDKPCASSNCSASSFASSSRATCHSSRVAIL